MRMNNLTKNGFTLAEILITLGIIGVVAAMTLPTVINNAKAKELETQLNTSYSILQQALGLMQANTGIIANQTNYPQQTFGKEFIKYFKTTIKCSEKNKCMEADLEDGAVNSTFKDYKNYNKTQPLKRGGNMVYDEGKYILTNNILLLIECNTPEFGIILTVDINGPYKKPNAYGHDLFSFNIEEKSGKLLPMGTDGTYYTDMNRYCSYNSNDGLNGASCTYKAFTEKDFFKNLPK